MLKVESFYQSSATHTYWLSDDDSLFEFSSKEELPASRAMMCVEKQGDCIIYMSLKRFMRLIKEQGIPKFDLFITGVGEDKGEGYFDHWGVVVND